jgi:hypothetical protein
MSAWKITHTGTTAFAASAGKSPQHEDQLSIVLSQQPTRSHPYLDMKQQRADVRAQRALGLLEANCRDYEQTKASGTSHRVFVMCLVDEAIRQRKELLPQEALRFRELRESAAKLALSPNGYLCAIQLVSRERLFH